MKLSSTDFSAEIADREEQTQIYKIRNEKEKLQLTPQKYKGP